MISCPKMSACGGKADIQGIEQDTDGFRKSLLRLVGTNIAQSSVAKFADLCLVLCQAAKHTALAKLDSSTMFCRIILALLRDVGQRER